jgi:hypothetical protein
MVFLFPVATTLEELVGGTHFVGLWSCSRLADEIESRTALASDWFGRDWLRDKQRRRNCDVSFSLAVTAFADISTFIIGFL